MSNRKPLTKKIRFEVFKRDKFTCQYCGGSAPEVVLEVDHIIPVFSGGDNNIMNLITSCKPCNIGKKHRELSDDSVLTKQKKQIEDLEERKQQIRMMAKWRDDLLKLDSEVVVLIEKNICNAFENQYTLTETSKDDIKRWVKQFTLNQILDSIDLSAAKHLRKHSGSDKYLDDSVSMFIRQIPRIAYYRNINETNPALGRALYIRNQLKFRFRWYGNKQDRYDVGEDMKNIIINGGEQSLLNGLRESKNITDFFEYFEDLKERFNGNL
ncbi:MAG: HNH endonuclease [Ignavibacteriales bacterium]|nr:HNH endonuclease [Ignavibacteriales bacterium]